MDHESSMRAALSDDADLELRFQCGQSLPVHSLKLKLASSVLKGLISAVMEDVIASSAAKRRRTAEDGSSSVAEQQELPSLKVSSWSLHAGTHSMLHITGAFAWRTPTPTPMRRCDLPQVDGAYEDWAEVLRLVYYSGAFPLLACMRTLPVCTVMDPHRGTDPDIGITDIKI